MFLISLVTQPVKNQLSDMNDLKFTSEDCDHVIRKCLQRDDVKTVDFEIIPRHLDNYIFKITYRHGTKEETCCLYAKTQAKTPKIDTIFEAYKTALPEFDTKISPKFCCGKSELLFFEDLTYQKFQNQHDFFTLEHIKQTLKVLAEVHAAGFAYEERRKCDLGEQYGLEPANFSVKDTEDLLWSLIDNKDRVAEVIGDLEERQTSSKFRRTLCHGHLARTNILFHYTNGEPDGCRLINFKCSLYASPIYDVLQLVFFNSDEDTRQKHFDTLLDYYHGRLEEEMGKYGLDVDQFLPNLYLLSHHHLPLIKLEAARFLKQSQATKELKEVLTESRITREDCYVIVKKKIESADYMLQSFNVVPFLENLKLEIKIRHSWEDKILSCFVKTETTDEELFVYTIFAPKLQELGIGILNECVPTFLYTRTDVTVFDDLSILGYRRLRSFDTYLLSVLVKKLARFHAASLILEDKVAEETKRSYRLVDNYGKYFAKMGEDLCQCFRNVLSVGKIGPARTLVQYDDDRPIDCRFVNYESIKYCPPALDFLLVIYSTERSKDEEELKKVYYNELSRLLSSYNCSVCKFLSYQEFTDSVDHLRLYAAGNLHGQHKCRLPNLNIDQ